MKFQQIRNATMKLAYGNITFVIDPWLQDRGKGRSFLSVKEEMKGIQCPLNDLPFSPEDILKQVDYLLVSHVHPDHFTVDYLPKDIKIIVQNDEDRRAVTEMGFQNTLSFHQDILQVKDVKITRVDGIHGNNDAVAKKMGKISGFILQHPKEKTIYICGDTIFYQGVADNIKKYQPEIIVVNCCEATVPMGRLVMGIEDVERVMECVDSKTVIVATHLDSVNHALVTRKDIEKFASDSGRNNIWVPKNGDSIMF